MSSSDSNDSSSVAWKAPAAFEVVKGTSSVYDVEEVMESNTELVLIRLPPSLTAKDLNGLQIDVDSKSATKWAVNRNQERIKYEVRQVGRHVSGPTGPRDIGGEELAGLTCFLPDGSGEGQVSVAPKTFSKQFIVTRKMEGPDFVAVGERLRSSAPTIRAQPEGMQARFSGGPFTPHTKYDAKKRVAPEDVEMAQASPKKAKTSTKEPKAKKEKKERKEKKEKKSE